MNIELENGMRFVANYRYDVKPEISQNPIKEAAQEGMDKFKSIKSADYKKFHSRCSQTMVGFVQNIPKITGKSYNMKNHKV